MDDDLKVGDYILVVNDSFAKEYNGNIGRVTICNSVDSSYEYKDKLFKEIRGDRIYPFDSHEVKRLSENEAMAWLI